ncbi:FkbM family methyltransferase [Sulfuriflexus sp.]|uniref:FkbM family methyltransferase n=1 Tax=Sulfuriflexus sp. TaxID=2015443 RepID=UPI0028CDD8B6|nr:FkbM family methyltransferase [Sulfuriflexus sp.]MDT8404856.1 FkbM family methyltransferase [Sulfuriflexus sp.]
MAKLFWSLMRKTAFKNKGNLVSLDDHYQVMAGLLKHQQVSGILDAGASTGRITGKFLKVFPKARAYAFEPQPMYRERLTRLAEQDSRIQPQFLALGEKQGSLELQITRSAGCTSLFKPSARMQAMYPDEAAVKETARVDVVTIDEWRAEQGNPGIEVMKFDIQGGELAALRGAPQTLRDSTLLVYTELLFNPLYEGGALYSEIDLCLREAGFMLYNLYKPKTDKNGMLMWSNAIFVHAERLGL